MKYDEDKFNDRVMPITESGCWVWLGGIKKSDYGGFYHKGKVLLAHRVSYEIHIGDIVDGMCVCHSCDNPICVNPDHLWLGSHQDNMKDMVSKGRNAIHTDENNHSYDSTVRKFLHKNGSIFIGTSFGLRLKYRIPQGNLSSLIHGRRKSCCGWRI